MILIRIIKKEQRGDLQAGHGTRITGLETKSQRERFRQVSQE
jgi:hypothetical protein